MYLTLDCSYIIHCMFCEASLVLIGHWEQKLYLCAWGSYACNHSSISMFGFNGGVYMYWHMLISFPFPTILQTSKAVVGKSRTYITVWFVVVMRNVPYAHKHSRVMFLQDYSTSFTTLLLQRRPSTAASAITCLWLRPLSFLISERVEYPHCSFFH